jgi:hypothetical protein
LNDDLFRFAALDLTLCRKAGKRGQC